MNSLMPDMESSSTVSRQICVEEVMKPATENGFQVDGYNLETTCFPSSRLQSKAGRKDGKVNAQGDSSSLVLRAKVGTIKLVENKKLHKQNEVETS